ncbi:hypothetical protein [Corynebacterium sp. LK2510]|uniref:hypothetical protein n=1 Tax=Corynebacterium sp. LK2510 TaxID=3110472 RepID=UPI0034CDCCE8
MGRTETQVRRRKMWAWVGVVLGGVVMFGAITDPESVADFLGSLLAGAAFAVPGAWWLYCEREDRRALEEWQQRAKRNAELKQMLGSEYETIARGMGDDPRPEPMDRKWRYLIGAAVALVLLSGMLG